MGNCSSFLRSVTEYSSAGFIQHKRETPKNKTASKRTVHFAYSAWVKGGSGNAIKTDMFIIAGGAEGETATYTLSEVEPTA